MIVGAQVIVSSHRYTSGEFSCEGLSHYDR